MEGTQTLNGDNGVLQPQAKGSDSSTGSPELLDPQVRSLPAPDYMQAKPSFHDFLLCKTFFITPLSPTSAPLSPAARDFQVSVSSTCFSTPRPRAHPASSDAPPSLTPQTSLQPGSPFGLCRRSWTTPM